MRDRRRMVIYIIVIILMDNGLMADEQEGYYGVGDCCSVAMLACSPLLRDACSYTDDDEPIVATCRRHRHS